ncbi:MAG: ParA family protein [Cyanobacteria bacterium J069]|nr:MAG: cobyrinic acid a,c-diamide synthase [Cyanobacteria bacterium J069]
MAVSQDFHQRWGALLDRVHACKTEKALEEEVILPLLILLGYDQSEIIQQAPFGKKRVDFLVKAQQTAPYCHYLIIEAKAPKQSTAHNSWQLRQYLRDSGSILGLLTNGNQFRLFYNDGETVHALWSFDRDQLRQDYRVLGSLLWRRNCDRVLGAFGASHRRVHHQLIRAIAQLSNDSQVLSLLPMQPSSTPDDPSRNAMIITVFNNKGGVGKTTLTVNLAAALSQLGKRVLLIDIDAQANLTTGLGIDPLEDVEKPGRKDITHLLTEPRLALNEVVMKKRWGNVVLDIVPAHIRLSYMENQLIQIVDSDRILAKKLKNHGYDFVFIDPPPSFGKVNRISLMASGGVLVPTQLSPYPIRALEFVLSQVEEVGQFRETSLPVVGIAVSMHDRQSRAFNLSMVEELYGRLNQLPGGSQISMFSEASWVPRLNVISKSQSEGCPLFALDSVDGVSAQDRTAAENALLSFEVLAKELLQKVEVSAGS